MLYCTLHTTDITRRRNFNKSMAKYFDIRSVLKEVPDANYYLFQGERSNGKTYSALSYALDRFVENGEQFVYVRRYSDSISARYMRLLFAGNKKSGDVATHLNKLGYDDIEFYSSCFWALVTNEKGKKERVGEPIGYTMAINTWETAKGGSMPDVTTIIFDEYLTRKYYLPNEPILFENLVSSVVRDRDNVKVIMLANTVSWACPYYSEWGLNHVRDMKQGTFDIYGTGDGKRKIVICYTEHSGSKRSDVYFNYDNPRSRMITEGVWETAMYPRIPENLEGWDYGEPSYMQSLDGWSVKLQPAQTPDGMPVLLVYDNGRTLVTNVPPYIDKRYRDRIIYTDTFYPCANVKMAITKHSDPYSVFILTALKQGRVFYQNNTVGENVRNYLKFSQAYTPIPS